MSEEKGIPNHTETGTMQNCTGCRFCHELMSIHSISRNDCVTYVCGLLGTVLASTPDNIKITIRKNCGFNYYKLELENKAKESL
jgi:hypothetical protein